MKKLIFTVLIALAIGSLYAQPITVTVSNMRDVTNLHKLESLKNNDEIKKDLWTKRTCSESDTLTTVIVLDHVSLKKRGYVGSAKDEVSHMGDNGKYYFEKPVDLFIPDICIVRQCINEILVRQAAGEKILKGISLEDKFPIHNLFFAKSGMSNILVDVRWCCEKNKWLIIQNSLTKTLDFCEIIDYLGCDEFVTLEVFFTPGEGIKENIAKNAPAILR